MLTADEQALYKKFLTRSILERLVTVDQVFPLWRELIHELLKANGCPCTTDDPADCFLAMPENEQKKVFAEHPHLSLVAWVNTIQTATNQI